MVKFNFVFAVAIVDFIVDLVMDEDDFSDFIRVFVVKLLSDETFNVLRLLRIFIRLTNN